MSETVELAPDDGEWPRRFEQEQIILTDVFKGAAAQIEHVGSTSVPGMVSKPIIDIMPLRREPITGRSPDRAARGRSPSRGRTTFTASLWAATFGVTFGVRDYLRAHPDAAAAYAELKRQLASRSDRSAYFEGKTSFVQAIVARAVR